MQSGLLHHLMFLRLLFLKSSQIQNIQGYMRMPTQGAVLERVQKVQYCAINDGVTTTMCDLL